MRPLPTLAVGALCALGACAPPPFTVALKGETTVRGDPLMGTLGALPPVGAFTNLDFDRNQEFQNQGVTKDMVSSVRPRAVRLRVASPDTQDFGFLDSIAFYARAGTCTSGPCEVLVAEAKDIGRLGLKAPNPVLSLAVNHDAELQPYVAAPSMSIVARGSGRMPPQDVRLEATVELDVQVQAF